MVQKGRESYHARYVIKKASELNFVKVFETCCLNVAVNSLPDESSRTRCKHGPKLFREPGKLQKILWMEIHGSLEECVFNIWMHPHFVRDGTS